MNKSELDSSLARFFAEVRTDGTIVGTSKEKDIHSLVKDQLQYVALFNLANHADQSARSKRIKASMDHLEQILEGKQEEKSLTNVRSGFESLMEKKRKPVTLDIDDIASIAYTIGRSDVKNRHIMIAKDSANAEQIFSTLVKSRTLNTGVFEKEIGQKVETILTHFTREGVNDLLNFASNYGARAITLLRLSDGKSVITDYIFGETVHKFKQVLKGDLSSLSAQWHPSSLTAKRKTELAVYFKQQADLNLIRLKMLIAVSYMALNTNEDPLQKAAGFESALLAEYDKWGFSEINLTLG